MGNRLLSNIKVGIHLHCFVWYLCHIDTVKLVYSDHWSEFLKMSHKTISLYIEVMIFVNKIMSNNLHVYKCIWQCLLTFSLFLYTHIVFLHMYKSLSVYGSVCVYWPFYCFCIHNTHIVFLHVYKCIWQCLCLLTFLLFLYTHIVFLKLIISNQVKCRS